MSEAHDRFREVLAELPDTFVMNDLTLSPVIPPDKFGLVFYASAVDPVPQLDGNFRDPTWTLAIISPVTKMEAAADPLFDALYQVLDTLDAAKTTRWENATLEPYNDTLWCYTVQVKMYTQRTEEEEPA